VLHYKNVKCDIMSKTTDENFGPYKSREEWLKKMKEHDIDLKESGPQHTSPFGAILTHKADCGCSKTLKVTGAEKREMFDPCKEHRNIVPGFNVEKHPNKPSWEDKMLKRDPHMITFDEVKPGDTLVVEDENGNEVPLIVKKRGKGVGFGTGDDTEAIKFSTNHPSRIRNQFMPVGRTYLWRENDNPDHPLKRKNKPEERYPMKKLEKKKQDP